MKITQNLLLRCSSLFILLLISLQTSLAINPTANPHICSPSSCGIIHNISFPFRLKHDPQHCGDPKYELSCKKNITYLYLNSQRYKVKAINYHNFTIRVADVSINNSTCSFPTHSLYACNFDGYPYSTGTYQFYTSIYVVEDLPEVAWPVNFMSCPYPLKNSSFLTDCATNSSNGRHTYMKAGHMNASDVRDMCRIDKIVMTSWKFEDVKNVSVLEIHDSLPYGFELSWIRRISDLNGNNESNLQYFNIN